MPPATGWSLRPPSRRCGGNCCWRSWCANGTARGRDGTLSFAQGAALADSLAKVMDEMETQGCDLAKLKDLAPADLAEHWEGVTRFLDVIRETMARHPGRGKALNPAARRNQALKALAARLEATPPQGMVIAAGSTGSIPATARIAGVIARLPQGAVVLPGLDRELDDESWNDLDPGHPQFGLKQLLRTIGVDRDDVQDWFAAEHNPRARNAAARNLAARAHHRCLARAGGTGRRRNRARA